MLCDLDGVVWLAQEPIPGSVEALSRLQAADVRVVFVTNNSFSTRDEQTEALIRIGVETRGRLVTSAMAAATVIEPGWTVLVVGGAGLHEEISRRGAEAVYAHHDHRGDGSYDAVVVGLHREFSYDVLARAAHAVRAGALLVGSNGDATYPTPAGEMPGGGSVLAAIEKASGSRAVVTGKPHAPMADLVLSFLGDVPVDRVVMVGDRPETDGLFARQLGCRFAHVQSGVAAGSVAPHERYANLAAVVGAILS